MVPLCSVVSGCNIIVVHNKNVAMLKPLPTWMGPMKYSEFLRWLRRQGVSFEPGKGSHQMARYKGKASVFPFHGSKEMPEPLRKKILKDLGL